MTPTQSEPDRVVEQLQDMLRAFQAAGRAMLPGSNDELLQSIVEAAARIFGAAAASIALVDEAEGCLEFRVSYGAGREQVIGMRISLDRGIAGYVAVTGEPLAVSNVREDPRFASATAASTGYVPQSILAMPLIYNERVIGVVEVLDKINAPSFGMQDMERLGLFARQAAIAIHQSQQYDLLGLGLLRCMEKIVSADSGPGLEAAFRSLLSEVDREAAAPGEPQHDLLALAEVFYNLSQMGESERETARQVLTSFSEYARHKASSPLQ